MFGNFIKQGVFVLIASFMLCISGAVDSMAAGNISDTDKYAWSETAGWINFNPGHADAGVTVYSDHLEGFAWGENIGWVKMGSYAGGGAHTYDQSAGNWGVNNDGSGNLSGYAWSEVAGWISFNSPHADAGVTIDMAAGSFDGYAWSENTGWIHFKKTSAPAYNVVTSFTAPTPTPAPASVMYVTSNAASGTLSAGTVIEIIVHLNQPVWVSGTPLLVLNTGGTVPTAAYYSGGSGTDTLTFSYTVTAGDIISNLEYWSEWALELNGGRIWDNMGNDVILDLPAPGAPGSLSGDIVLSLDTDYPVYRLYSPGLLKHLFTMDENEKAHLEGTGVWQFDGIAYYAFHVLQYQAASRQQRNTLQAVHRFYSEALMTHLFTIDENEKEHLIAEAADVWRYEGTAFYIPTGNPEGAVPVYRFYSEDLKVHLFTTDENEKAHLINTAGDVWRFEGVAYYAYP